ncbi:hypothetical protein WJX75_005772 [Coccomyxa subellipsoidea]|uniref:Uncharacterized protein n=1 Tax=Coccomyxa subellipsoidea TaxID=248742 RepID=A0ABR2YY46_9CHLO
MLVLPSANDEEIGRLQLDKDPTEILAEADLESQEVSSLGASADDPTRPSLAAASTRSRSDASPSSLRLDRGKRSQFGSAVIGINVSGTNQHNVAYLKRRIDELTRILVQATEGGESNASKQGYPENGEGRPAVGTPVQTGSLTTDDLAAAVPSNRAHLPLVIAGREWRKGMRAVVALAQEPTAQERTEAAAANETWVAYPDDSPRRSPFFAGDSRAAMEFGESYKWLLYGDDDTVFFPEAARQLLARFDPDLPYAITDNMWFEESLVAQPPFRHPAAGAPRCLPCHFVDNPRALRMFTGFHPPGSPFKPAAWGFAAPRGCPCTPALLCEAEAERPLYGVATRGCADPPPPKAATFAIHGGAGAILSIGLMRRLNETEFESCVLSLKSTGGDAFFTVCLWRAGYAPTDPGYSVFNPEARVFDPFQWEWGNDSDGEIKILQALEASKSGSCDYHCQLRLDMMVNAHVRSRWKGVPYASAQIIKLVKAHSEWMRIELSLQRSNTNTSIRSGASSASDSLGTHLLVTSPFAFCQAKRVSKDAPA